MTAPLPTTITLHKASRTLELGYADGKQFSLAAEYLRVMSPSAEVRGHVTNSSGTPIFSR